MKYGKSIVEKLKEVDDILNKHLIGKEFKMCNKGKGKGKGKPKGR